MQVPETSDFALNACVASALTHQAVSSPSSDNVCGSTCPNTVCHICEGYRAETFFMYLGRGLGIVLTVVINAILDTTDARLCSHSDFGNSFC